MVRLRQIWTQHVASHHFNLEMSALISYPDVGSARQTLMTDTQTAISFIPARVVTFNT